MKKQSTIDIAVFKRLLKFLSNYKKYLFLTLFFTIFLAFLTPLQPIIIGEIVNRFVVDTKNAKALTNWILILVGLALIQGLFEFLRTYFANLMAQSVIYDIRKKLYAHLMRFKTAYFDKTPIGSLVTRVVSDIEAISDVFSSGMVSIIGDSLLLIVILVLMFVFNWQLALISLLPMPFLFLATRIFARAMRKSYEQERVQVTKLNTFAQEHLSGMSIVQLFNREKEEYKRFTKINAKLRHSYIIAVWAFSIFVPVVEFISALSIAFILAWGGWYALGQQGDTSKVFGEIFTFTLWINMLFRPVRQLADKFNILQRGVVRAERIFQILDLDETVTDKGTDKSIDFNQDIEFKGVHFAYKDEDWILKGLDLKIPAGKMVAVVGATGAGKTTIVSLLFRFYNFQKGDVTIGGKSINDIKLEHLRRNIVLVLQDVFLFSDTIYNNITLGNDAITREQVIEASKAVGAHNFIMKLPGDYDFVLGERGGVLSVGQRQLVSFIRAYVYQPTILILDEATSSIDSESEAMIQHATDKITQGRTSIIIAHRLSTIQKADMIVVLDHGKVMETGSHQELIEKDGFYRKLYDKQFSEV